MNDTKKATTTILNCLDQIENSLFDHNTLHMNDYDDEEDIFKKMLFDELQNQLSKSCSVIKEQICEIEKAKFSKRYAGTFILIHKNQGCENG